ncbi:MAG TPA: hypothetical protein VN896_07910 [Methylomirabilota bacterium]|nr:hypothetical protein [Methylomirabilota bacterium]
MGQPQEIAVNTLPFWSRFTLTSNLVWDATNTFRTIFAAGTTRKVFDYRQGEQQVQALEGSAATNRDTILVKASQTRGGGMYTIYGVSYTKDGWAYERADSASGVGLKHTLFLPASLQPANGAAGPIVPTVEDWRSLDSLMVHIFTDHWRTQINIDGTRRVLEMGPAALYPGVGGAAGGNVDTSNGGTYVVNYMHIPEGMQWNPAGATDSNFIMSLECTYDVVVPTWTNPTGTNPTTGAAITGANPTALGRQWTQGWICNFHGEETSPTSNVS